MKTITMKIEKLDDMLAERLMDMLIEKMEEMDLLRGKDYELEMEDPT